MKITPGQIGAARALLNMTQAELAAKAKVSIPTVKRVESHTTKINVAVETRQDILTVLENAGIEFTNGDAPGVRLTSKRRSAKL